MTRDEASYAATHLSQAQALLSSAAYGFAQGYGTAMGAQPATTLDTESMDRLKADVLAELNKAIGWINSANRRPKIEAIA